MRPRLLLASVTALGLGLTATACSTFDPNAATVNGTEVRRDAFEDDLTALRENEQFANASPTPVAGELTDSTSTTFAANELTNVIMFTLVQNEVDARGLTVDPAVREEAAAVVPQALLGPNVANGDAIVASLPEGYRNQLEGWVAAAMTLALDLNGLTYAGLPQYYEANKDQFAELCLTAVPAATEADANAALQALNSGADMATVVSQYSPQPGLVGPNGELSSDSCFRRDELAGLAGQFDGKQAGDLVGPIDLGGIWAVFKVGEPKSASFEDARGQVLSSLLSSDAYVQWQQQAAGGADVSVDPRYGRWDGSAGRVVAPGAESPPTAASPDDTTPATADTATATADTTGG